MTKKSIFSISLLLSVLLITGCDKGFTDKAAYFDGKIVVNRNSHNSLIITTTPSALSEPGTYQVVFSKTPGHWANNYSKDMPKDFNITSADVAGNRVLDNFELLPNYLRVTITHNGDSESRDFIRTDSATDDSNTFDRMHPTVFHW